MEEQKRKQHLTNLILEYATKMNALETNIWEQSQKDRDTDWHKEDCRQYFPIFQHYCTDRKRVYTGNPHSFGSPPQYAGIEAQDKVTVNVKTQRKAEVIVPNTTETMGSIGYLFVVIKKKDSWKIDSYKRWSN